MIRTNKDELRSLILTEITDLDQIEIKSTGKRKIIINLKQGNLGDGTPLCSASIEPLTNSNPIQKGGETDPEYSDLQDIFDLSGLLGLEIELLPGSELNLKSDNTYYFIKSEIVRKKMETSIAYDDWFLKIFSNIDTFNITLVPDTNFLMRRYYSNFYKRVIDYLKSHAPYQNGNRQVSIYLSRLTIMELERQINQRKRDSKGKNNTKQEQLKKEIRIRQQALSEILKMINEGAHTMQPYMDTIKPFVSTQGDLYADLWIRLDINNFKSPKRVIFFLTCDLTNALAAVVENIHTFYFYRDKENIENIKFAHDKLSLLAYNAAVVLHSCQIICGNKQLDIRGSWSGKTPDDWKNEIVLCEVKQTNS